MLSKSSCRPCRPRFAPGFFVPAALWLGGVGLCACGPGAESERAGRPRNAILISIDTLRPDHLGCYGHGRDTSPTLDALAHNGVRFADVTSAAPWTLPSHATMLTGLYPSHHGVKSHESRLPAALVTVAEEFETHGFETFAVVNTHNVGAPQFQLDQGFDHFRYIVETDKDQHTHRLRTLNTGETVISAAEEFLSKREAARPFFLFLHFYDVHTDFTPREEYRQRFVGPYTGKLDGRTQQLIGVRNRGETLQDDDVRWLGEMYDAEIRQFDDLLGHFLAWLAQQGLAEDTLFVVTSDHGEEFQEHGSVLHGRTQYQELLRVPLLIRGPGIPGGAVIETPVHGIDVTPTLLAIMGVDSAVPRDGIDLSPAWRGGSLPARTFFAEADQNTSVDGQARNDTKRMVRRGFEKLIVDRVTHHAELYDLAQDPGERRDLAAQQGQLARELGAELERFGATEVRPDPIPPPTAEEQRQLDALGYGGGGDEK